MAFVGAESPRGHGGRPVSRVCLDEVDRFPTRIGARTDRSAGGASVGEGNPREIARKRTETFGRRRMVAQVSTPVNAGGPIHTGYLAGDQRRLWVACPVCRERGILGWLAVDFDLRSLDPETREPIGPEPPPVVAAVEWSAADGSDAALVCRRCAHRWSDADRIRAVDAGEWVPERPEITGRRSFHIWAGYSPLSRLPDLAGEWIAAQAAAQQGDVAPATTFRQTGLGLPVGDDHIVTGDMDRLRADLLARRESPKQFQPPADARAVGAVDVQGDRLEMAVWAWSPDGEGWLLAHEVIPGTPEDPDTWDALDAVLVEPVDGRRLEYVAIDGGNWQSIVDGFVARRQRAGVYMVKGQARRPLFTNPTAPTRTKGFRRARLSPLWVVGVDEGKRILLSRLAATEGPRRLHLPAWVDTEHVMQLTAEQPVVRRISGRDVITWEPVRKRNEMLDLSCYAIHALQRLRRRRRPASGRK